MPPLRAVTQKRGRLQCPLRNLMLRLVTHTKMASRSKPGESNSNKAARSFQGLAPGVISLTSGNFGDRGFYAALRLSQYAAAARGRKKVPGVDPEAGRAVFQP